MDSLPLPPDDLQQLVTLFDTHRLLELEWREGPIRVHLQTAPDRRTVIMPELGLAGESVDFSAAEVFAEAPLPATEPTPEEKGWIALSAPITGTFYRAPGPDDPNFVEVGDAVEADQTFGLIEAMKIFSEILCETSGVLMEIVATAGQMVQSGQVLGWIQPV